MSKKRILFVDDDPKVLQGLQRMLRPMHDEWEVETVDEALAALSRLDAVHFDVVVSDMRMPHMDGAEFLNIVMQKYPHIVRIILSGHSDQEMIFRAIGPSHQYLAKPCDAALLKETIHRVFELRDFLKDERLCRVVAKMQSLPSLPTLYLDILKQLNSKDPNIEALSTIISQDIGMTSQILRLVNSAYFGYYSSISTLSRAITVLGLEKLTSLVLSLHLFSKVDQSLLTLFNLYELWQHSLRVAKCAQEIALQESANTILGDTAFMAGLLHDAGQLIFMLNFPDAYAQLLNRPALHTQTLHAAEIELFGASHMEIAAYLFGLWGMSHTILEAIAYHHDPSRGSNSAFSALTFVYIANHLDRERQGIPGFALEPWDTEYLKRLQISDHEPRWRNVIEKYHAGA